MEGSAVRDGLKCGRGLTVSQGATELFRKGKVK